MAIKTNLKSFESSRNKFKQEITLLSHGYASPKSFPDGVITVYPWDSSIDDWLVKRGRKGDKKMLMFELLKQVCDLNGCPLDSFILGDVNTVLLVSRAIANENVIVYDAVCPYCRASTKERLKIPDQLVKVGEKSSDYAGYDDVTLPLSSDAVRIRPLTVADEKILINRTPEEQDKVSDRVAHILAPILAVSNDIKALETCKVDNLVEVLRWYEALHPKDKAYLEDSEDTLYPHLDQKLDHRCDACNKPFQFVLQLDQDFFRPESPGGAHN